MRASRDYTELLECGRQNESEDNIEEAIRCYKEAISHKRVDEFPFSRLMILYRKEKNYDEELRIIDKAIEIFKAFYDKRTKKFSGANKLGQLSKALLKNLNKGNKGLDDYPAPLPAWMKRKELVEQKLGKAVKRKRTRQ